MQRKPGFPVANCSIKMPDSGGAGGTEPADEEEQQQRRQQLINFGHAQWGFNNWSWSVTKQDLDFVDFASGKFCAGVVAFVSVSVKSLDIHRENIGYATALAPNKGFAVYKARKCAVTNGLKETLLSFGGNVATELMELLETHKTGNQSPAPIPPETLTENNQNIPNKVMEPKNSVKNLRKDSSESVCAVPANMRQPAAAVKPVPPVALPPPPARQPPAPRVPIHVPHVPPPPPHVPQAPPHVPQAPRPNSNVSFVLQPVMPGLYPPRPHVYPNYYEYSAGPWHFTYEPYDRHQPGGGGGNVNLNFNLPPKSLVVTGRGGSVECKSPCARAEGEPLQYTHPQHPPHPQHPQPSNQGPPGCWIKPTIFYDGFWTEQKVKKWVAEQVEKQFPEEPPPTAQNPAVSKS